jgi:hypothetical protein
VPEFDRFVAELSTQFINLPGDRINEAIRKGLCRVCAEIALDRSTLYRIDEDRRPVDEVTGSVNGGAVEGDSEAPLVRLPWSLERVLAGTSSVSHLPRRFRTSRRRSPWRTESLKQIRIT